MEPDLFSQEVKSLVQHSLLNNEKNIFEVNVVSAEKLVGLQT